MHGLSMRARMWWLKVHKFRNGRKPLCNQVNAHEDPEAAWKGLPKLRCGKCLRILQKS